jgi:hypothetical protein
MTESDYPWRDPEVLRDLYVDEEMSTIEVADELGTKSGTISKWLDRHDIEARSISEAMTKYHEKQPVPFSTSYQGYEVWKGMTNRENVSLGVHRLAAVAWFGLEAVANGLVHHENEIPWDNREENLQPMSRGEHNRVHNRNEAGLNGR